jgi:2-polyprenyl-3-methyl-5-hydroxy-6-metoxy-1,4-benzoquinol methylase
MSTTQPASLDLHTSDEIRSRPYPNCFLCGAEGELLYGALTDRLFRAPGIWSFKRCPSPECGLVWLDPVPMEEDISKAYAKYYTHDEVPTQRTGLTKALRKCASVLFSLANPVNGEGESLSLMCLDKVKPGKLLDVGCGNGVRLARLRSLGWDVYGQDIDPAAVAYARETFGLEAHLGLLEDMPFAEKSFDCITLNHVIEHAHDPVALLQECRRLLKVGGLLVIVTPNASSFACRHFGPFWRGLEPPRHIHLFSPKTLSTVAVKAGFSVSRSSTSAANARSFARASLLVKNGGGLPRTLGRKIESEIYPLGCLCLSILQHSRDAGSGEECVLQATH